ncbi:hypothetical protein [Tenacibaculum ovolyticum]|uniref:hypothetical protein n=1 Tax=Tenacibaculum ovolyticum TaxID=104270 RepID=UPI003BAA156B
MKQKPFNQQTHEMTESSLQKIQKTIVKGRSKITSIIAVLLPLIGITASFSHSFFTPFKENPARFQLKKEWNKKETSHNSGVLFN